MVGDDATQPLENALPLVGRQGLPELAGLSGSRRLARARGGTAGDGDRRMMALLASASCRVNDTSLLTGAVRLPLS
jgi:hypothetical protein